MTNSFSLICQIRDFGSGQILQPRQLYRSPGLAKIAPWWLARRDSFSAKVAGLVSADGATNVYSLNRRAVIANAININDIDNSLTSFLNTATAYLAHLLLRETQSNTQAKAKEPNPLALFD
ncbi:MAG: hypothetical protein NTV31_04435 [Bacteroidia bacterium]|nr:hypothetical protein [Bacteroidia bacterium]